MLMSCVWDRCLDVDRTIWLQRLTSVIVINVVLEFMIQNETVSACERVLDYCKQISVCRL